MKEYKNLTELESAHKLIIEDITNCIFADDKKLEFVESVGGNVFVVETIEDLKEVKGAKGDSLFNAVTVFDAVEMIGHDGEFLFFLNVNSSNGGPSYYVPKAIYLENQNCIDSYDMNNGA